MYRFFIGIFSFCLMLSCQQKSKDIAATLSFEQVAASKSGVDFVNQVVENVDWNIYENKNLYNGGGIAVGDINQDGLPDIFFVSNRFENKLYLNKGGFQFEDITASAGVAGKDGWATAAVMVDVNGDALLDIYVCQAGIFKDDSLRRANQLFINQGDLTFSEEAVAYGLDDTGNSNYASFFDYDRDGDLDVYIVNHPPQFSASLEYVFFAEKQLNPQESDNLFRQEADGTFTKVTAEAGITNWAFGLSATCRDFNQDGWPDLYITNDFSGRDNYWINQGDGTFKEGIFNAFNHISNFSMGSDAADINHDGWQDLMVVDMVGVNNYRKKANMSSMRPDLFWENVRNGHHYQYMQNSLQLNNGNGTFSDIAELAGVTSTDWSWTALFSDLDNDGWDDLLVTNGIVRDVRNNDHFKSIIGLPTQLVYGKYDSIASHMPSQPLRNFVFQNQTDLTFKDQTENWKLDVEGFTHGAVTADLDRDGDLDVIFNNHGDTASIYQNQGISAHNYLQIFPQGEGGNTYGIGLKVKVKTSDFTQTQELFPGRGYLSSLEPMLHFGVGEATQADEIEIIWPDGRQEIMRNVKLPAKLYVKQSEAKSVPEHKAPKQPYVAQITAASQVDFRHRGKIYDDFAKEILLPYQYSRLGNQLAVGDINQDGLEDFYAGNGAGFSGKLFVQDPNGSFHESATSPWVDHAEQEDITATFLDLDGDGDQDLYVGSGSNEWPENSPLYQDRIYLNEGNETFRHLPEALPQLSISTGCVLPFDFDQDGDLDLFVGGRLRPGFYPHPASSILLENIGGKMKNVTADLAPDWQEVGMVTDAHAFDYDRDGDLDIIISAEWQPIRIYRNDNSRFIQAPNTGLENFVGWWYDITPCDLNQDGKIDFIAGNLGKNSRYKSSENKPFEVFASDFDANRSNDIVLAYHEADEVYPLRGRECSSDQMPFIKSKFKNYNAFAQANVKDIFGAKLDEALHYQANWMYSSYLKNKGDGSFELIPLPNQAQVSAVQATVVEDVNQDGFEDVMLVGNLYAMEIETPRQDASVGLVLLGNGKGDLKPTPVMQSGFFCPGDVKDLVKINRTDGNKLFVSSQVNGKLEVYTLKK